MHKLVLFIKSYRPDFERAQKLLASIEQFNEDNIPVYLSINDKDYNYFKQKLSAKYTILRDSDIVQSHMKDAWRYQSIVKSQVYKLGICENYLCIDSDSVFIRPFRLNDFMYDEHTPYTIMHENKSFMDMVEVLGMDSATIYHVNALHAIRKYFGTHGKLWDYGPNPYLWSCKVWQHFNEVFLATRKQTFEEFYIDIESLALPHEACIYGEYLRKTKIIDIVPIEGFFKVYHFKEQFELEKSWYDEQRLAKNYLGIIMQSNWQETLPEKKPWYKIF